MKPSLHYSETNCIVCDSENVYATGVFVPKEGDYNFGYMICKKCKDNKYTITVIEDKAMLIINRIRMARNALNN